MKGIKSICRKLKSVIKNVFKIRKFNLKVFKAKLHKLQHDILKKPLFIIIMLSIGTMYFFLLLPSIPIIGRLMKGSAIKGIFNNIILVSFTIFVFVFTIINVQISKTLAILRMYYLYMVSPVIAIGSVYLLISLNDSKIGIFSVVMSIMFFVIYALFTFYICHRDIESKFFRLALSLPIYIAILSFSAFIFGAYYYSVFHGLPRVKAKDAMTIIRTYARFGFKIFYSFNDTDTGHYTMVTLCQYYFGKLLDIFMLGFIFYKLTEPKILSKKEIDKKDLKKRKMIIKRIRAVNMKKLSK